MEVAKASNTNSPATRRRFERLTPSRKPRLDVLKVRQMVCWLCSEVGFLRFRFCFFLFGVFSGFPSSVGAFSGVDMLRLLHGAALFQLVIEEKPPGLRWGSRVVLGVCSDSVD